MDRSKVDHEDATEEIRGIAFMVGSSFDHPGDIVILTAIDENLSVWRLIGTYRFTILVVRQPLFE
jgi:hypothetical protein